MFPLFLLNSLQQLQPKSELKRAEEEGRKGSGNMGNSLSGKSKRIVEVMKADGTTLKLRSPVAAESVLKDQPGHDLFEAAEVKRLGLKARPLHPDAPLLPGRLYFLVELPPVPDQRLPRRAWSGALNLGARERLESLRLSRRSMSDVAAAAVEVEEGSRDRSVRRLTMRLPKAEVERLMQESKDSSEVAAKIMELCVPKNGSAGQGAAENASPPPPSSMIPALRTGRKEKRARFAAMPDEVIA